MLPPNHYLFIIYYSSSTLQWLTVLESLRQSVCLCTARLCGLLTNPSSHFSNLVRRITPKLELLSIVCNFYVLSFCSLRDLSRETTSFHQCFCFVDGVTPWEQKKKRVSSRLRAAASPPGSTGYPLWFCQLCRIPFLSMRLTFLHWIQIILIHWRHARVPEVVACKAYKEYILSYPFCSKFLLVLSTFFKTLKP